MKQVKIKEIIKEQIDLRIREAYLDAGYSIVVTPSGQEFQCENVCVLFYDSGYCIYGRFSNFYKHFKRTNEGLSDFLQYRFKNRFGEDKTDIVHAYMKQRWLI